LQGGKIFCEGQMGQCDGFTEAGGGNISVAYFLSPGFAIMGDAWVMAHSANGFTFSHYINTVGIKWRPFEVLTLTAGIGAAHASLSSDNGALAVSSGNGGAVMGAASFELVRGHSWALSLEARFGNGFYGDNNNDGKADIVGRNVGFGVGLTFFNF
jgi:hypothetical protein